MNVYIVGGAVRDMLMGKGPKDVDYVVVGSTPEQMIAAGYKQVGADFPVFLHPETGDEYALARRERSTGDGYLDFDTEFGTDVTLEEDLMRRDLTVNAISMERMEDTEFFVSGDEGHFAVFDPFGGKDDIDAKVLRHTSDAFMEDPVRVLRLARFRARFGPDWTVAKETRDMVHSMAKKGVLNNLQPDRIWKEMSRALMEDHPRLFFDTLLECDALQVVFPEIYKLKTALESMKYHPEGNAYEHTMLCLTQAARCGYELDVRYATLVHDIGKGLTPRSMLPKHYGHDVKGVAVVEEFSRKNGVPSRMRDHAKKATRYHMYLHKMDTLNAKTFVKMFDDMNVLNDPHSVNVLYSVGVCDERGRLGSENNNYDHLNQLIDAYNAYKSVKFVDVFPNGEKNANRIQDGLRRARTAAVAKDK
jgi:tRNA nucleotidyltransferase (CCA-adding enzyme)